jgi:hypothetical protein
MADAELQQKIVDWFEKKSTGEKKKFYLKDLTKALVDETYDKKTVKGALNACIEEGTVMWFSTGSTNMLTLPRFHKG